MIAFIRCAVEMPDLGVLLVLVIIGLAATEPDWSRAPAIVTSPPAERASYFAETLALFWSCHKGQPALVAPPENAAFSL